MSASTDRRTAARQKAQQLREAEQARARRRRAGVVTGAALAVLALVVGIGIAVQASRNSTPPVAAGGATTPRNLVDGGVLIGQASAPVTVTTYEDFQCPACKTFEEMSGGTLEQLHSSGEVKVISRPVAILDRFSDDEYSTRSLNAAACLVDVAPQAYPAFAEALFAQQPAEGGPGLPDAQLVALAQQAGGPDISACVRDRAFESWTRATTDQASRDGLQGTPYVLVNGTPLSNPTPEGLQAAVAAAG